jgi:hypothetical protein
MHAYAHQHTNHHSGRQIPVPAAGKELLHQRESLRKISGTEENPADTDRMEEQKARYITPLVCVTPAIITLRIPVIIPDPVYGQQHPMP